MLYQVSGVRRQGQLSLQLLIMASITLIFISGFSLWTSAFITSSFRDFNRAQAFAIAEGGIEYYRWHLAHDKTDYRDGTGGAGPYVHDYYDKQGNVIGTFTLDITPPPAGSTIVTLRSTGRVNADPSIARTIEVRLGLASFARYAVAANDAMRFGPGTVAYGEIISNGGVRFDGLAYNKVKSAQQSYDDPDHGGQNEFGVHTHVNPPPATGINDNFRSAEAPPNAVPARTDVFVAGREFPVPALDFVKLTQNLASIKAAAIASSTYFGPSANGNGYDLELRADGTYVVYRIDALFPRPNGCTNTSNQDGWGTWSIQNESVHASGTIPDGGNMFFEDNLWVRGRVNNRRVAIGSGRFPDNPATRTSITINQDLRYTNYDCTESVALFAQKNVNVGLLSADILRIDGALVAQTGRVGRYYYQPPNDQNNSNRCGPTVNRQKITLFGMLGSNARYGFGYTDSTGYQDREIFYDANLLYCVPPSFPLTADQYTQISWKEVQ